MAKVLLVEDDNNLREIYQARLMAEGYDISAAQNGEEALVVAKQSKPDLIISDVMMPRISGFEMLDILRNTDELKHTKVIMLTALGQAEDQKRANNLGADRYLVKSQVTLEDIVNAAKELLIEDGAITDVPPPPTVEQPAPAAGQPAPAAPVAPVTPAAPEATTAPAPVTPQPATAAVVPPAPANPTPATTVATVPVASEPPAPAAPVEQAVPPATSSPALTPMPTPPPAPVAEPTAAPSASVDAATVTPTVIDPAVSAATAVTDAATQTLEAEEAALQSQINTYAQEPAVTPVAVEPSETPATDVEASNAQAITNAVQELNAATPAEPVQPPSVANAPMPEPPAPATPVEQAVTPAAQTSSPALTPMPTPPPAPVAPATPAAPAPTPVAEPAPAPAIQTPTPAATDSNVTIGGKKIIQPISDPASRPDLNALLAKEEAKESTPMAPPVVGSTPAQAQPMPPHTPGQSFDPNTAL